MAKRVRAKDILTGRAVSNEQFVRRMPILLFAGLLMMVYIAIGFRIQARHNEMDRLNMQIKELRTVAVATSALRTELTRREKIEAMLKERNIPLVKPSTQPIVIK